MKPITEDDIVVGNELLCVLDDYDPEYTWVGSVHRITDIDDESIVVVDVETYRQSLLMLDNLCDDKELIFVNYSTVTETELFLFKLSGRVALE